ncbi:MAG TPA: signal peptidase II [bacterium]|nr:signal peptidase II [bacterium]
MTIHGRKWLVLLVGLIFFIVDRYLKYFFLSQPSRPPIFIFHLWTNQNLAFGLPLSWGLRPIFYFFLVLIILIISGLFLRAWRRSLIFQSFALWFVLLGAISNTLDRFKYNAVIDFIDPGLLSIFNLADIMITLGVGLLCYDLFFSQKDLK